MKKFILTLFSLVLVFAQSCTTKDDESLDSGDKNELVSKNDSEAGEYFHMNFGLRDGTDSWYYGFKHNITDSYINKQKILTVKKK